jgi:hypothetical protein
VETEFLGVPFRVERRGTDGDIDRAVSLIREMDGQVDAFGLGGIDLYIYAGPKRYILRDAARIARAARTTPIVDGSGLKNTLERKVIDYLQKELGISFAGRKILMVCGVDRFGMAEAFSRAGAEMTFGDLIFALGIPIPLNSLKSLERVAKLVAPVACRLPIKMLYPTGSKQEKVESKHSSYYHDADVIAGDFHFIRRYMPPVLRGKTIITNTVTPQDIELLQSRGVAQLITTTPEMNGRSFGTNVMEGVLITLAGKKPDEMKPEDYSEVLDRLGFKPRVVDFAEERIS